MLRRRKQWTIVIVVIIIGLGFFGYSTLAPTRVRKKVRYIDRELPATPRGSILAGSFHSQFELFDIEGVFLYYNKSVLRRFGIVRARTPVEVAWGPDSEITLQMNKWGQVKKAHLALSLPPAEKDHWEESIGLSRFVLTECLLKLETPGYGSILDEWETEVREHLARHDRWGYSQAIWRLPIIVADPHILSTIEAWPEGKVVATLTQIYPSIEEMGCDEMSAYRWGHPPVPLDWRWIILLEGAGAIGESAEVSIKGCNYIYGSSVRRVEVTKPPAYLVRTGTSRFRQLCRVGLFYEYLRDYTEKVFDLQRVCTTGIYNLYHNEESSTPCSILLPPGAEVKLITEDGVVATITN